MWLLFNQPEKISTRISKFSDDLTPNPQKRIEHTIMEQLQMEQAPTVFLGGNRSCGRRRPRQAFAPLSLRFSEEPLGLAWSF